MTCYGESVIDVNGTTVILITLNHPGAPKQHLDQPNSQSKPPGINLSSPGGGDNIEETFSPLPSWTLTSVHKALTAVSGFKNCRTAVVYHVFYHFKVMLAGSAVSNITAAFLSSNAKAVPNVWAAFAI
jgi:hypothetical protein